MLRSRVFPTMLVLAALVAGIPAALAQVILDAPGFLPKKTAPAPPAPRAPPSVWPRLDPGAVLCRTRDDLERHAANMIARVSGSSTQPTDCQIIAQPTGVQIVSREGPGATQVKLNASGSTGWTDVWLPEKAPSGR